MSKISTTELISICKYSNFLKMMLKNFLCVNENSCLLRHLHGFFLLVDENKKLEGAYGHYFREEYEWFRAGKAAGTDKSNPPADLLSQNAKHASAALRSEVTVEKSFYTYFPSEKNLHNTEGIRHGHFVDLDQYSLLAFDRNGHVDEHVKVEGGIFDGGDNISKINSLSFYGSKTFLSKNSNIL